MSAETAERVRRLVEGVRAGESRAIARTISLIEDGLPAARDAVRELYPHTGKAALVGITGPPGVGKSTLISALVRTCREDGETVGVISVDPSSPFTEGAVLGDRLRLAEHFLDPDVYIRSMGTRGHLGGLSESSMQAAFVLDAAGKDIVFLETVGVGQSEVEVASVVDTVVLVLMPGSGDSVQALKAGVMEIPDVLVVNKKDHPAAMGTLNELRAMLNLVDDRPDWTPPLVATDSVGGEGVGDLWKAIKSHRAWLKTTGRLAERRRRNLEVEIVTVAVNRLEKILLERTRRDDTVRRVVELVQEGRLDPLSAAEEILDRIVRPE